jgi:RHS repeat-associated protein
VQVNGANNSQFITQTMPGVMALGQTYPVSVTLQNTGTAPWVPANYFLGSENPEGNNTWGLNRVEPAAPVDPGANVTFNFNVTAPSTAGTYEFQWRMVQNSTRFGAFTTNTSVIVSAANDAAFVSQSVAEVMVPGQVYPASVTMQNMGGTTWTAGSYFLGSENPQANTTWGLNRVELAAPVAPGANATFNFNVTAPSTVGTHNFQWRMVQDSTRFGAFTTNVAVSVQQAQSLYYVHADHLNTPRLVADATGTTVWRWDQAEPFGGNPANEDPDANSVAFDLPLRLPGQRYDAETGLHYNYFRDYDPSLGIYKQSDLIGLRGGLNT